MRTPPPGTFTPQAPQPGRKLPIPDFLSYNEVAAAVRRPAGQAKGLNGTAPGLLRLLPPCALFYLGALFETMTEHGVLPPAFASELYIALPKPKKDRLALKGWRGITILAAEARLFLKAIGHAFNQHWYLWMDDWQAGFAPGAQPSTSTIYKQWAANLRHDFGTFMAERVKVRGADELPSWSTVVLLADADMGYDRAGFLDFAPALAAAGLSPRRARALTLIHEHGVCVSSTADRRSVSPTWVTLRGAGQGVPHAPFLWNAVLAFTVLKQLHVVLDKVTDLAEDGRPRYRIGVPMPADPTNMDAPRTMHWIGHAIWADDFAFCFRSVAIATAFAGVLAEVLAKAGLGMSFPKTCIVPLYGLSVAERAALNAPRSPAADAAADRMYTDADNDAEAGCVTERTRLTLLRGSTPLTPAQQAADTLLVRKAGEAARCNAPATQPFDEPAQLPGFRWTYLGGNATSPLEVYRKGITFLPKATPTAQGAPAPAAVPVGDPTPRSTTAALSINQAFAALPGKAGHEAVLAIGETVIPLASLQSVDWPAVARLLANVAAATPCGRRKHIGRRLPVRISPTGADLGFHLGPYNNVHIIEAAATLRKNTIRCYGSGVSGRRAPPSTALATALQMAWAAAAPGLEIIGGLGEAAALDELEEADTTFVASALGAVRHTSTRTAAGKNAFGLAARQNFNLPVGLTELGLPPLSFRIARWRLNNLATFAVGVPLKAARELFDALFYHYLPRPGVVGPVDRVLALLRKQAGRADRPFGPRAESSVQLVGTMALALFLGLDLNDFAPSSRPRLPENPAPADPGRLNALKSAIRRALATASTAFLEDEIYNRAKRNPDGHSAWLLLHGMTLPHRHILSNGYVAPLAIHDRSRHAHTEATAASKRAAVALAMTQPLAAAMAVPANPGSHAAAAAAGAAQAFAAASAAAQAASAASRAAAAASLQLVATNLDRHVRQLRVLNGALHATTIRTGCCTHLPALHSAAGNVARDHAHATASAARRAEEDLTVAASAAAASTAAPTAPATDTTAALPLPGTATAPQTLTAARTAMARARLAEAAARIDTCPHCAYRTSHEDDFAYTLEHIFVTCAAAATAPARTALFTEIQAALTLDSTTATEKSSATQWLADVRTAPSAPYTSGSIYTLLDRRSERRSNRDRAAGQLSAATAAQELALRGTEATFWRNHGAMLTNASVFAALALGAEGARGTDTTVGVPGCDSDAALFRAQLAGAAFLQSMDAIWDQARPGYGARGLAAQSPAEGHDSDSSPDSDGDERALREPPTTADLNGDADEDDALGTPSSSDEDAAMPAPAAHGPTQGSAAQPPAARTRALPGQQRVRARRGAAGPRRPPTATGGDLSSLAYPLPPAFFHSLSAAPTLPWLFTGYIPSPAFSPGPPPADDEGALGSMSAGPADFDVSAAPWGRSSGALPRRHSLSDIIAAHTYTAVNDFDAQRADTSLSAGAPGEPAAGADAPADILLGASLLGALDGEAALAALDGLDE
jgi:hypothetical protein